MKLKIIKNDLFNIVNRLKKLDKSYFVVFNFFRKRYEVHSKNQKGSSLCFVVDKPYLNSEVLTKAHKTSVRNSKKLLEDIISNNKKLQEKDENYLKEKSEDYLKDYIKYANKKGCDCSFDSVNKTPWV